MALTLGIGLRSRLISANDFGVVVSIRIEFKDHLKIIVSMTGTQPLKR
jgi:hypothetical protein